MTRARVSVRLKGKKKALQALGRRSKRLNQWTPLKNQLHQIYLDDMKKFYKRKYKVGDMEKLGPSVIEKGHPEHYFIIMNGQNAKGLTRRTSYKNRAFFRVGTTVEHAKLHSWWRVSNPKGPGKPLLVARAKARKQIAELIMRWVATGKKR